MIKHNNYFDGHVQSLGFNAEGQDKTLGVVLPGDYHFGTATRKETMQVITGVLTINGQAYFPNEAPCVIAEGGDIQISTTSISSYLCLYN